MFHVELTIFLGSVRRNRDGHLIHANVHTDVIVEEQPSDPLSTEKPEEIYKLIEHFCLGRRRLELFGCQRNIRPGWVSWCHLISVRTVHSSPRYLLVHETDNYWKRNQRFQL